MWKFLLKNDNLPTRAEFIEIKIPIFDFPRKLNGSKYYFADGGVALFSGGKYEIDAGNPRNALRVEELEYIVDSPHQPIFSRTPVRIIRSDSKVMRAIDRASDGNAPEEFDEDQNMPQTSGVGFVNSQNVRVIAGDSNATPTK